MPVVGKATQQPSDVQDYDINFSSWFPAGDTLSTAEISVTPVMPTPPSYAIASPRVKVWIYAGGTTGVVYKITVKATTINGRVKEVELKIKVRED